MGVKFFLVLAIVRTIINAGDKEGVAARNMAKSSAANASAKASRGDFANQPGPRGRVST
jgi:hypothetical protein